jgi:hypothetical protein
MNTNWFINGEICFESVIADMSCIEKWQDGKLHCDTGPAIIYPDGTKEWYQNGLLHRVDGPAIEYPDGTEEYFLEGIEQTINTIIG